MLEVALLPVSPTVEPAVLALNNAHAAELSWLNDGRLTLLLRQAFHARRIGEVDGFLLAFDENAAYDSPNYLWFRQRYRRFVYVDRVVVALGARGRGYAGLLYADLFDRAGQAGHDIVVCEVNRDPPNPASDAFHTVQGFAEVGQAAIHQGNKTVRYLARALDTAPATTTISTTR
jgi:predicted GNAT superfamily acetyltransferase